MDMFASNWIDQLQLALLVTIATIIGAAIGAEREMSNKPAGLRTHALLAAASALFVGLAEPLVVYVDASSLASNLRPDPIRIAEAIVTGVAFIGAGTIFRHRGDDIIEGLTTAASLLLVAALAVTVVVGQILLAGIVTLLSLAILRALRRFTHRSD